jgi:hypothetical protein
MVGFMAEQKVFTPLKIGLLASAIAYFLFTFHGMFTLSWIGEWNRMGGGAFGTMILVEDISATIGLIFRFAGSIIALAAVAIYFAKKGIAQSTAYKAIRIVLVFEGIYWLGLIATTGYSVFFFGRMLFADVSVFRILDSFFFSALATIVEGVILPVVLFILAFKLSPKKPLRGAVKWAGISGLVLIVVFWLVYTGIWVSVIQSTGKGIDYLWVTFENLTWESHPEHLVSFITTAVGLPLLALYTTYFIKKASQINNLGDLKVGTAGVIILGIGMYFLWNYFSWAMFAGDTWNDWYAWFLGHNMDLWMLVLPLVGLPLIFHKKTDNNQD